MVRMLLVLVLAMMMPDAKILHGIYHPIVMLEYEYHIWLFLLYGIGYTVLLYQASFWIFPEKEDI